MSTPLFPMFKKRVTDAIAEIIRRQVVPWAFMTAGPPFRITTFHGRQISYQGIEFDGSPRQVFWSGYIEPFLEDICVREIEAAVSAASTRRLSLGPVLREVQQLLSQGCAKVYHQMADVDRRLRGRGFPKSVTAEPVDKCIRRMNAFVGERVQAEIEIAERPVGLNEWWRANSFYRWAIGMGITIVVLVARYGGT